MKSKINKGEKEVKTLTKLCIVVALLFLTGCASIVSKSEYPVNLRSNPDGANVTVRNRDGHTVFTGTTPTTVNLKAGAGFFSGENYIANFEKEGFDSTSIHIRRDIDLWYIGNIVFGGLIGFLIVDPATGAMWRLQSEVFVSMQKQTSSIENKERVKIILLDQVPMPIRSHMIRLN